MPCIITSMRSSAPYGTPSTRHATLFYRSIAGSRCFGIRLIPDHLRRFTSRPVSFYALFKWWLLLSQHPGCLRNKTSSLTKIYFGTLDGDQGCFPFDLGGYPPRSFSRGTRTGIRSLIEAGSLAGPCLHSVALPPVDYLREATPKGISRSTRYLHV